MRDYGQAHNSITHKIWQVMLVDAAFEGFVLINLGYICNKRSMFSTTSMLLMIIDASTYLTKVKLMTKQPQRCAL